MSLVSDSAKNRIKVGTLTKLAGAASFLGLAGFCVYGLSRQTSFSSSLLNFKGWNTVTSSSMNVFEGMESPGKRKSSSSISSWQIKLFEKKINNRNK